MSIQAENFELARREIDALGGPKNLVISYVNKLSQDTEFLAKLQCGLIRDETTWPNKTLIAIAASDILMKSDISPAIRAAAIQALLFSQMQLTLKDLEGIDPSKFVRELTAYQNASAEQKEIRLAELSTRQIALRNTQKAREFIERITKG